jgi:SH3-like domain-containing protein
MRRLLVSLAPLLAAVFAAPAGAQGREVPYWATLRADHVNMRVGPSEAFPIEWVYRRTGLPVKVVRIREGWRLVQDPDGERGWIVARLLSPDRGAIVIGQGLAEMRESPDTTARVLWRAEPGVVGRLRQCSNGWCELDVEGRKGWVRAGRLWGAGEP